MNQSQHKNAMMSRFNQHMARGKKHVMGTGNMTSNGPTMMPNPLDTRSMGAPVVKSPGVGKKTVQTDLNMGK